MLLLSSRTRSYLCTECVRGSEYTFVAFARGVFKNVPSVNADYLVNRDDKKMHRNREIDV